MRLDLGDRPVLVTGGASNIGRAVVLAFAAEGARVAILDRDEAQAERTAAAARAVGAPAALVVPVDLVDAAAAAAAVKQAADALAGLEIVVNNVGGTRPGPFLEMGPEQWRVDLDLNLGATIAVTAAALKVLVAQGHGSVVSIVSDAAWGEAGLGVYGAAKAGVLSLMRSLAREHGRDGLRFNVVTPGVVLPEEPEACGTGSMWRERSAVFNDQQLQSMMRRQPLRRLSTGDDVAQAVLFLASERCARQLTGQVLSVSGGFVMP